MGDIPVNPIDGDDDDREGQAIGGDTVPEQLRWLADHIEEEGHNIEFAAVAMTGVDRNGNDEVTGFDPMSVHLMNEEAVDSMSANETMNLIQQSNEALTFAALEVGFRDAVERSSDTPFPFPF